MRLLINSSTHNDDDDDDQIGDYDDDDDDGDDEHLTNYWVDKNTLITTAALPSPPDWKLIQNKRKHKKQIHKYKNTNTLIQIQRQCTNIKDIAGIQRHTCDIYVVNICKLYIV